VTAGDVVAAAVATRPLRYRDAQLAQFTVDSGRSPERIRRGHRADEGSHGDIRVAAPWT